jgi:gliding motility-associated-like protein
MKKHSTLLFITLMTFSSFLLTAKEHDGKFNVDLSHQSVFIENKGQLDTRHTNGIPILFGTYIKGTPVYFTSKGLVVAYAEYFLPDEVKEEMEEEKEIDADEEIMEKMQTRYHYVTMNWQNTSGSTEIQKVDETPFYFTYPNNRTGNTVITRGYKKIIYKNIYPAIDAEYILPEEGGMKYNLVLHPGSDISKIKLLYSDADKITLDKKGNITIASDFLTLVEHAPNSFYEDQTPVASSFLLNADHSISFSAQYQTGRTLIIDPFVSIIPFMPPASILPANQPVKTGFDVCYDYKGNVYIYGGASPYHAMKFSAGGTLLWDAQFPDPIAVTNAVSQVAGDMEVDKRSGSVYVSEGFGGYTIGACIYKLNTLGVMVAQMNGLNTAAFSNNLRGEISRMRLDYCTNIIHMTCGGVPTGSKQVAQIDTAFSIPSYHDGHVTVSMNGDHDACLMTLDPKGQYMYINFNRPDPGSPDQLHDNEMHKIPLATYNPSSWINPGPTYSFVEVNSISYGGWSFPTPHRLNMFNGMVCGNKFLYTCDGKTLKKWNKNSGAMISSLATGGKMFWSGGIDIDNCDNVYVGVGNTVKIYDFNLNLINTIALPDTSCYDLKVDVDRKLLYACGNGYVTSIPITIVTGLPQVSVSSTPLSNCSACNGTASALVVAPPTCDSLKFSYLWTPGGQTTSSVTGLCAGNYSVQISWTSLLKCSSAVIDTVLGVTLTAPQGSVIPVITANNPICFGSNNGSATASVTGGTAPYTYNWSNGQITQTATGLAPGNYTVLVTDASGCSGTQVVTITQPTLLTSTLTSTNILCHGANNGSAAATAAGGSPVYSYLWSNGQTTAAAAALSSGSYSVTITDSHGCTSLQSITITEPPALVLTASSVNVLCFGNSNGSAAVAVAGGTPGYSYLWSNGQTSSSAAALASGNYVVTVTDAHGCTSTQSVTVVQPTALTVSVTPTGIPCSIGTGSAVVVANGGTPSYNYTWSNGQTTSATAALISGSYSVIVTDANGCSSSQTFSITSSPAPVAAFAVHDQCVNAVTQFTDNSSGNPVNWLWNFGDGNSSTVQNPSHTYQTSGTYTITLVVSLAPGCSDTIQHVMNVHPLPVPNFSAPSVCAGNTTSFSDLSTIVQGSISSWNWNFGNGNSSTQQNPSYTYASGGNFNVTLTVTSNFGCSNSVTTSVSVHSSPTANFCVAPLQQPISYPVFNFCDQWSSDVVQWTWSFGDGNTNTYLTDPAHSYSAQITGNDFYSFEVCLNVQNQFGCWDTTCKTVEILPEFTFYIPNTFTPNGDHTNEFFFGKGRGIKEYQIMIFDRWGNMIWDCEHSDTNVAWDQLGEDGLPASCKWNGAVEKGGPDLSGGSGQQVQEDVYVWKVELKDIFNKRHDYVGHVNVVK